MPGFVRVDQSASGSVLTLPDFIGNFFFNTLGNITAHPKAGLLFVDHETGGVLQLTGRAAIIASGVGVDAIDTGLDEAIVPSDHYGVVADLRY